MDAVNPQAQLQLSLEQALAEASGSRYVTAPIHMTPVWEGEHQARIMQHIASHKAPEPGEKLAHAGVAGWFNFDVFAAGKHTHLLLMDTNLNQTTFWKDFIALLVQCKTPEALRKAVLARYKTMDGTHPSGWEHAGKRLPVRAGEDEVLLALHTMPWMRDNTMYDRVREAAIEGRIVALDMNIYDRERLAQMRRWCDEQGVHVTSIYASNIEDFNKDTLNTTVLRLGFGVNPDSGKEGTLSRLIGAGVERVTGRKMPRRDLQYILRRGRRHCFRKG